MAFVVVSLTYQNKLKNKHMYFTKEEADGLVISFGCNGADLKPNEETLYRWAKEDIREKTENE